MTRRFLFLWNYIIAFHNNGHVHMHSVNCLAYQLVCLLQANTVFKSCFVVLDGLSLSVKYYESEAAWSANHAPDGKCLQNLSASECAAIVCKLCALTSRPYTQDFFHASVSRPQTQDRPKMAFSAICTFANRAQVTMEKTSRLSQRSNVLSKLMTNERGGSRNLRSLPVP